MDLGRLFVLNLKKWRKITGLSQKELAEKCGTAHSYIRQLESGKGHPSFAFLGKVAEALQIEPYQLLYDDTIKPSQSYRSKHIESVQTDLLQTVSIDILAAFDELKKHQ